MTCGGLTSEIAELTCSEPGIGGGRPSLRKSRPDQGKRTRNPYDRFGIQDHGRERPVQTLLTDSLGHVLVHGRSLASDCSHCLSGQVEQFVQISCHWLLKTRSGPCLCGRVALLLHKPDRLLAMKRTTHLLPALKIFELLKSTFLGTISRYFNTFILFV